MLIALLLLILWIIVGFAYAVIESLGSYRPFENLNIIEKVVLLPFLIASFLYRRWR